MKISVRRPKEETIVFYDDLGDIKFSPEISVSGLDLPIDEMNVSVKTADDIAEGQIIELYGNDDKKIAKYWIVETFRKDSEWVSIRAQSVVGLLDRTILPARFYLVSQAMRTSDIIERCFSDVFTALGGSEDVLQISVSDQTYSIYFPQQTAKERLQWVCAMWGYYVQTSFSGDDDVPMAKINKLESEAINLQKDKVFYKPDISRGDDISSITTTSYEYTQGTPSSTDDWIEYNGDYYIVTKRTHTLRNPNISAEAMPKEVEIADIISMSSARAEYMLARLATYYFSGNKQVNAEILEKNGLELHPGNLLSIPINDTERMMGYIQSSDVTFGKAVKQKITLQQVGAVETGKIIVEIVVNADETVVIEGAGGVYEGDSATIVYTPDGVYVVYNYGEEDEEWVPIDVYEHEDKDDGTHYYVGDIEVTISDGIIKTVTETRETTVHIDDIELEYPIGTEYSTQANVYIRREGTLIVGYMCDDDSIVVPIEAGTQRVNVKYNKMFQYDYSEQTMTVFRAYDHSEYGITVIPYSANIIYDNGVSLDDINPRWVKFQENTTWTNLKFIRKDVFGELITVTKNGTYIPEVSYRMVTADPTPDLEDIFIDTNGSYYPEKDGFGKVSVAVTKAAKMKELEVKSSGYYTPPEGYDAFSVVNVNIEAAKEYREILVEERDKDKRAFLKSARINGKLYSISIGDLTNSEYLRVYVDGVLSHYIKISEFDFDESDPATTALLYTVWNSQIYSVDGEVRLAITRVINGMYIYWVLDDTTARRVQVPIRTIISTNRLTPTTAVIYNERSTGNDKYWLVGCYDEDRQEINTVISTPPFSVLEMPDTFYPSAYNDFYTIPTLYVRNDNYAFGDLYVICGFNPASLYRLRYTDKLEWEELAEIQAPDEAFIHTARVTVIGESVYLIKSGSSGENFDVYELINGEFRLKYQAERGMAAFVTEGMSGLQLSYLNGETGEVSTYSFEKQYVPETKPPIWKLR